MKNGDVSFGHTSIQSQVSSLNPPTTDIIRNFFELILLIPIDSCIGFM